MAQYKQRTWVGFLSFKAILMALYNHLILTMNQKHKFQVKLQKLGFKLSGPIIRKKIKSKYIRIKQ